MRGVADDKVIRRSPAYRGGTWKRVGLVLQRDLFRVEKVDDRLFPHELEAIPGPQEEAFPHNEGAPPSATRRAAPQHIMTCAVRDTKVSPRAQATVAVVLNNIYYCQL